MCTARPDQTDTCLPGIRKDDVSLRPSTLLPPAQSPIKNCRNRLLKGLLYLRVPTSPYICHITIGSSPNTGSTTISGAITCSAVPPVSSGSPLAQSQLGPGSATTTTTTSTMAPVAPRVRHASGTAGTTLRPVVPSGSSAINLPLPLTTRRRRRRRHLPGVETMASGGQHNSHSHRHRRDRSLSPSR